jgi:cytochrome c-type biogenesis protein CcmE
VKKQGKFLIAASAILLTLSWLAWVGATESQTYYHTIAELNTLTGSKAKQRMRIGGDIRSGSIQKLSGRVDFVIEQEGHALEVSYVGKDPLPDTFVDGAQAVVEGRRAADGRFVAEQVQAKCASKYEAKPGEAKPGYGSPDSEKPAAPSPGGVKKS